MIKAYYFVNLTLLLVSSVVLTPIALADEAAVTVDTATVAPGSSVSVKGEAVKLYDGQLREGDNFVELAGRTDVSFPFKNMVTLVSIVPSLDTPVCEMQTYEISQLNLGPDIDVITVSRDLPMAQSRFAREHKMDDGGFVSDYKSGAFGKSTGLMMQGRELLARGLIVLDGRGVIRHIQIVPEVSHLPDISKAVAVARGLAAAGPDGE